MFGSTHPMVMPRPAWQSRGLCVGNPGPFFNYDESGRGRSSEIVYGEAKAICGRCPVRKECLDYALDNQIRHGVWGGMSERERRVMRHKRVLARRSVS